MPPLLLPGALVIRAREGLAEEMVIGEIEENMVIFGKLIVLPLAEMHGIVAGNTEKIEHRLGGPPRGRRPDGIGPQVAEGIGRQDRPRRDERPQKCWSKGSSDSLSANRRKSR